MSSLEPASVSSPASDRQAGLQQADLSPPNLSSMLIINPTYSALPVSLHHKLTFLFFSLPLPLLCPSLSLFLSRLLPVFPPLLFSLLQQSYSRENYWRWGVWEKQELLPGAGRASHGRHESAERCGTEPVSFSLDSFSVSHSLTLSVSSLSLFVASVSPQAASFPTSFTWTFTLLYLLLGTSAHSPSAFTFTPLCTHRHPELLYIQPTNAPCHHNDSLLRRHCRLHTKNTVSKSCFDLPFSQSKKLLLLKWFCHKIQFME